MKSIEWIDRLIAEKNLPSDRQAALLLGMTRGAISAHRVGTALTLDDKAAYRLEELLGLEHGTIVADQHAERESDPYVKAMWRKLGKLARLPESATLAVLLAASMTVGSAKTEAAQTQILKITVSAVQFCPWAPLKLVQHTLNLARRLAQMLTRKMGIAQDHLITRPAPQFHQFV